MKICNILGVNATIGAGVLTFWYRCTGQSNVGSLVVTCIRL